MTPHEVVAPGNIVFLSAQEVQSLLTLDDCIVAVEHAFRLYGEGNAPPPAVLSMHMPDGGFHIKAGILTLKRSYFAAKINSNFPENAARFALPTIQGVIALCDATNGSPLALMDSRAITSMRTAAATAVAAKFLARPDAHTLTLCGCGDQGGVQVQAISRVLDLREVFTCDQHQQRALDLAGELSRELKIAVMPVDNLRAAVLKSDLCITCTTSRTPLLHKEDVAPGTFIAAVGADNPHKQELHPDLMAAAKIVVDVLDQCAIMGDLHHALDANAVTLADVHAELGEIVAGKKPGRESPDEITIFDSTGMALQDVAAAAIVFEKWQATRISYRPVQRESHRANSGTSTYATKDDSS
jgi:alanine dehydrogenase